MHAVKQIIKYEKLAEIAHRLGAYRRAAKWSAKAEKLLAAVTALKQIEEKKPMIEIKVQDMRFRGKPGYVAKIVNGEKQFLHGDCDDHSASTKNLTYQIVEDGIYEICDANFGSRKRDISFIKVVDGEITSETDSLAELLLADIDLPELEGSEKQINWANSIRAEYFSKVVASDKSIPDFIKNQTSAKFWIDNRNKIKLAIASL